MYADTITDSMKEAIDETERRRAKQIAYNEANGIDPQPLRKKIADILDQVYREADDTEASKPSRSAGPGATRPVAGVPRASPAARSAPVCSRAATPPTCRAPNWPT